MTRRDELLESECLIRLLDEANAALATRTSERDEWKKRAEEATSAERARAVEICEKAAKRNMDLWRDEEEGIRAHRLYASAEMSRSLASRIRNPEGS